MVLYPLDELAPSITRYLSHWDRGLRTRLEAFSLLLEAVVWTVYDHPGREREVAAILRILPPTAATDLLAWLREKRNPGGGWVWPPNGAIGSPSGQTVFRPAERAEVALYETVDELLRERIAAAG